MNKKALGVFVSLLVVAMLALPMSMVHAENDRFIPVSGTMILYYDGETELKYAGNLFVFSQTDCTVEYTGDIVAEGTCDFDIRFIKPVFVANLVVDFHRNLPHTVSTFTSPEIDGVQYEGELTIAADLGNWRILGGTGDLANIHGQGTIQPTASPLMVEYEGYVHFDS